MSVGRDVGANTGLPITIWPLMHRGQSRQGRAVLHWKGGGCWGFWPYSLRIRLLMKVRVNASAAV